MFSNGRIGSMFLASFAAVLGLAAEARADFLVICPTATDVLWGGDAEGLTTRIQLGTDSTEQFFGPSDVLQCGYGLGDGAEAEIRVPDDGSCEGTALVTGLSAVFGRSEFFTSAEFAADARVEGDECVLRVDGGIFLSLLMSTECTSNRDGLSFDCPDDAFQVPIFTP